MKIYGCICVLSWVSLSSTDWDKKSCWILIFSQFRFYGAPFCYLAGLDLNPSPLQWEELWGYALQSISCSCCYWTVGLPSPPTTFPQLRVFQPWFWTEFSWQFVGSIFFTKQSCHDKLCISPDLSYSWILKWLIMKSRFIILC